MRSKIDSRALALAALAGFVAGVACKGSSANESPGASPAGSASAPIAVRDKACCKGKNDCKGKGGCAVAGKHECAGKNDCKGQGGCNMHCPN
jgi:hypothetical protein